MTLRSEPSARGGSAFTDGLQGPVNATLRWWRVHVSGSVEHEAVMAHVADESGWSPRFAFMTLMSAGIAVLGLLLSSPAVVIGAMLISPLMGPIMGLGFSLAVFDAKEMRRSIAALAAAAALAVAFTAMIVLLSPLKATTTEILARTRPNLFDLLVALFSALAGAFALVRGRGETIVGVAIATALMPPLATVGYGLATGSLSIAAGAFALFATNFVTIALAATIMARLYGFGHRLSSQQSWLQTILLLVVFVLMGIPLAISLDRIAREALIASQVRGVLKDRFGRDARVTQLDIDYEAKPLAIRAIIIAPKSRTLQRQTLAHDIETQLGQPVSLQADHVLVDPMGGSLDQERTALAQAQEQQKRREEGSEVARLTALAAGVSPEDVLVDRDARRAVASARLLPGATLAAYRDLEDRVPAQTAGWSVEIAPPPGLALPPITFAQAADTLDESGRNAALISIWAARRWKWRGLAVPGLTVEPPLRPTLIQRRAAAVAALLRSQGVAALPAAAPRSNGALVLQPAPPPEGGR